MIWQNEPPGWLLQNRVLTTQSAGGTDFWRKTHGSGIRDNGHFYYQSVTGDFTTSVKLTGGYRSQYDQAGLMARVDDVTWLKCGIELKDGVQYASVVVTRDWSDWSVVRLEGPHSIWLRMERKDATFEVSYSLDGKSFGMIRQAYLTESASLRVGPMIAAPKGDGFEAKFEEFAIAE